MSIQESAIAYHDNGFNCAQSVLAALQEETGLDESTAKRVAAGFGGGVRCGEICGSITAELPRRVWLPALPGARGEKRRQGPLRPYDCLGRTARRGDPRREQSERITRKERKR